MSHGAPSLTPLSSLQHIPGRNGWPVFGDTFACLKDPLQWAVSCKTKYGNVVRSSVFFEPNLMLTSADLAEQFLLDKDQLFSSERGWSGIAGRFFQGGLLLRDLSEHKLHRRIMQQAFKREAVEGYAALLQPVLERRVCDFRSPAYPWVKRLMLDAAATIFLGIERHAEMHEVNRWFVDVIAGATSIIRKDIPGTTFARGLESRRRLASWVKAFIPVRRDASGRDMLSILCSSVTEDGQRFSDEDIVDHIIFLLMAAHDTTTSGLTMLLFELGRSPQWQERVRANPALIYDCFREVLRLYPPVRLLPRRTRKETQIGGYHVPAHTQVWLQVEVVQRDPTVWSDPEVFDPDRFSLERAEHKRHRFAWIPFGGGVHTCLGMQFSELQVTSFMSLMLTRYRWSIVADELDRKAFTKPKNDLVLQLTRL